MRSALALMGLCLALASSARADPAATAGKPPTSIRPARLTCQDFLSFDELTRPKIVYWSQGLIRKGNADHAVFDVDMANSLVPYLVEECTRHPRASYWKTMQDRLKRSA
jgi:acid stress chaperone HdeA